MLAPLLCLLAALHLTHGSLLDHEYDSGEIVNIWTHTVSFEGSPAEKQSYYSMPLCVPPRDKKTTLVPESPADALLKDVYQKSMVLARFLVPSSTATEIECSGQLLTSKDVRLLERAIKRNATYQWYVGGISVTGPVGGYVDNGLGNLVPVLYTHKQIDIGYNSKRIVEATLRAGRPEELEVLLKKQLTMTYEILWHPSAKHSGERFNMSDSSKAYFVRSKRWVSLSNTYLVAAILLIIIITLYRNALGWSGEEHFLVFATKEVFHTPEMPGLFSALLGLGAQCMTTLLLFTVIEKVGGSTNTPNGNELLCKMVLYYGISGFVGGAVSGKAFAPCRSRSWLYPYLYLIGAPFVVVMTLLMCMDAAGSSLPPSAIFGPSSQFSTYSKLYLSLFWLITVIPLTFAGTLLGRSIYRDEVKKEKSSGYRKSDSFNQEPSMTSLPIASTPSKQAAAHKKKWYKGRLVSLVLCALAGGSVTLSELSFIYEGVWNVNENYCYITYGITLLGVFGSLLVSGFAAALGTYYTLGTGNFHWKWTAVECGILSGIFALAFSWNYYMNSGMYGTFQMMSYVAFSTVVSGMVALSEGFAAYMFSKYFIENIYKLLKSE